MGDIQAQVAVTELYRFLLMPKSSPMIVYNKNANNGLQYKPRLDLVSADKLRDLQ